MADSRAFTLEPRSFETRCGGLFLFLPDLVRLRLDTLAREAKLPGSKMIPSAHALRSALALELWSVERNSHVMALAADEGLALFAGLNAIPKKSFFSEYSSRIDHRQTTKLLAAFERTTRADTLCPGESFNLDFHSVPFYGDDPVIERHYIAMRSRRQKSVLTFLAQDADGHSFCYSNADIRKGEENDEIFAFISFWKRTRGSLPRHLVFDSRLTTYANLMNSLSSSVGLKVGFDMAILVIASGLYRLLARTMRGYSDAQARQIFRDLIDMPANVTISDREVAVRFHRRAHLPILLASGLFERPIDIPWWQGRQLRLMS